MLGYRSLQLLIVAAFVIASSPVHAQSDNIANERMEQNAITPVSQGENAQSLTANDVNSVIENIEKTKASIETMQTSSSIPCFSTTENSNLSFEVLGKLLGATTSGEGCPIGAKSLSRTEYESDKPENDGAWVCLMLRKHLDADKMDLCTPDPSRVFKTSSYGLTSRIEGKTHYFPFVNLPYRYQIIPNPNGSVEIQVRISLAGTPAEKIDYQIKLGEAAKIWSDSAPPGFKFRFLLVEENESPDFSIKMNSKNTRVRYDQSIHPWADSRKIAHEIGHMMGLDDEYDFIHTAISIGFHPADADSPRKDLVDLLRCRLNSLMCGEMISTKIDAYNYYMILRRGICVKKK